MMLMVMMEKNSHNNKNNSLLHPSLVKKAQLAELWCQWTLQTQLLRSALLSKRSDSHFLELISSCMALYKAYICTPSTTDSLLDSVSGRNVSPLEAAFMWLGSWRPTSAITLVYSKMGHQVRNLDGSIDSVNPSCLLSKAQLAAMEVLQNHVRAAEVKISNQLATLQMLVADQDMTEAIGVGSSTSSQTHVLNGKREMATRLDALHTLFAQSNRLRLRTLQELLSLLTPMQAAQCAVAAFELLFSLKNLGHVLARETDCGLNLPSPSLAMSVLSSTRRPPTVGSDGEEIVQNHQ